MNNSLIRLVSFDVTGTLVVPSLSVGAQYAQVAWKHLGVNYDITLLDEKFKRFYKKHIKTHPLYGLGHGMSLENWWYSVFCDTLLPTHKNLEHITDMPNNELVRKAFHDVYYNFQWSLIPNALETLKTLKDLKCFDGEVMKTMVVSNSDNRTDLVLSECGLAKYIDVVVTSMDAGCCKPDPFIFEFALSKFKHSGAIGPEEVLHVGDNYDDYIGAKNAGFQALLLVKDNINHCPDVDEKHTISNLYQIIAHVKHK